MDSLGLLAREPGLFGESQARRYVGEKAQRSRALVALAEDLGLAPSTHVAANHLKLQFQRT